MSELTREAVLDNLTEEHNALLDFLSVLSDVEWHGLTRNDGWSVHDIAAHIADVYLTTVRLSGVAHRMPQAAAGLTLPMMPDGRVNVERFNMLRYQANRGLSRDEVMKQLAEAFASTVKTIKELDEDVLDGPGPYGPPHTMLTWFNATVLHVQEHRLQLVHIYAART
jgi:hypothetical protein